MPQDQLNLEVKMQILMNWIDREETNTPPDTDKFVYVHFASILKRLLIVPSRETH